MRHLKSTEIGQRIKLLRQKKGLTQEALAEIVGVTFQQIQKYESGLTRLNTDKLQSVAEALSVPVSVLMEEDEVAMMCLTTQEKQLVDIYRGMKDEKLKECLFVILENLVK